MPKKENNREIEPEVDSEVDKLKKLGVMFDALEKKALDYEKKQKNAEKDIFIEKANKQKSQEKILKTQEKILKTQEIEILETSEFLDEISSELVGSLFIPIDLFLNDGLESKGITPISEAEIQKLLTLLIKLLPKDSLDKITEITKQTKKIDWLKNIGKAIGLIKHSFNMFYKRYKQYKTWKDIQNEKGSE